MLLFLYLYNKTFWMYVFKGSDNNLYGAIYVYGIA